MNTVSPGIKYPPNVRQYDLKASEDLYYALLALGFEHPRPTIARGCHWGDVYFFDQDLELAYGLIEGQQDKYVRIETRSRYFYLHPRGGCIAGAQELINHWEFSVERIRG